MGNFLGHGASIGSLSGIGCYPEHRALFNADPALWQRQETAERDYAIYRDQANAYAEGIELRQKKYGTFQKCDPFKNPNPIGLANLARNILAGETKKR